jgi:segregation and condensation protein A
MMLQERPDFHFQLPVFEGPLDLLLRLIEREELDITTIALAQVADQYLAHVRNMEAPNPATLSAFLVMAGRLLLLKSRALLPRAPAAHGPDDPVDEGEQLARQLREYQRFKQVAALLHARQEQGQRTYGRVTAPPLPVLPRPDKLDVTIEQMIAAMQRRLRLMRELEPPDVPLPAPKILTVPEMSQQIRERLNKQEWIDFTDLLSLVVRRVEVIVTLWSVLEMLKRREVTVEQRDLFGTIMIGRGTALQN